MNEIIKTSLLLSISLILAGCKLPHERTQQEPAYIMKNKFDVAQAGTLILGEGQSSIEGNAFLRKKNGEVITCAGSSVLLIPYTEYANERFNLLYGNSSKGYRSYYSRGIKFSGSDTENYRTYQKETICDSAGKFKFDNLKEGSYFVATSVTWSYLAQIGKSEVERTAGGYLFQKVQVNKSESKNIVITQ